jgi:hypothetical protein
MRDHLMFPERVLPLPEAIAFSKELPSRPVD